MKYLPNLILLLLASQSVAQHTNFNTQRNWSLNKKEVFIGGGVTQFTGDLGGRNRIGTDFSVADIDLPSTSWNFEIGYRYRFHPYWATSTVLNFGHLKGDDSNTGEITRRSRNLHFRSTIVELSQRLEVIVIANEKFGARYNISRHRKRMKDHNEQVYLFAGMGVGYFNPKALFNGRWVELRPLRTEGQGLVDGPNEYSLITATVPVGIGFRYGINRMWRIGLEATYVKTFSDYIDDVSGTYYSQNELAQQVGSASAYLSNPSTENTPWFSAGQQRGDVEKDAYYYINLKIIRNVTYRDYARQRKIHHWKGRYKF